MSSVMEIQNLFVNHESRAVKSNSERENNVSRKYLQAQRSIRHRHFFLPFSYFNFTRITI